MGLIRYLNWAENEELTSGDSSGSENGDDVLNRTYSIDSLNSMYMMNYGKHISRMLAEHNVTTNEGDGTKTKASAKGTAGKIALRRKKGTGSVWKRLYRFCRFGIGI